MPQNKDQRGPSACSILLIPLIRVYWGSYTCGVYPTSPPWTYSHKRGQPTRSAHTSRVPRLTNDQKKLSPVITPDELTRPVRQEERERSGPPTHVLYVLVLMSGLSAGGDLGAWLYGGCRGTKGMAWHGV